MLFVSLVTTLPGDWSILGLARGELQRASTGEMGGAIMLLLCLAAPPTRPGQKRAGRGKVRKKTGRVKSERSGAERREEREMSTSRTGERNMLSWNSRRA